MQDDKYSSSYTIKQTGSAAALSADNSMPILNAYDVASTDDDFHAMYWPMDKWINDESTAEMLNTIFRAYPELRWDNPLSIQFNNMLSILQNRDWVDGLIEYYDYTMVDFMHLMLINWPELFKFKRYAKTLSATVVSCLL